MGTFPAILRSASLIAAGLAFVGMLLMFAGTFTVEWTCRETGSTWECVGPKCDAEATKRFDTYRRSVACERTDWPMTVLAKVVGFLLPNDAATHGKSAA